MAHRWSLEGPAFEFPTPYGTENRLLYWRGGALIGLALLVVLAVVLISDNHSEALPELLAVPPAKGSVVPHLIGAMLLTVLGALDLLQAAARRSLLLAPGQPASLLPEVAREGGNGSSPGAAAFQRMLEVGAVKAADPAGPYDDAMRMLGPDLAAAPTSLHAYLRHRFAHLSLAVGLALVLLLAVLTVRQTPALALVSLFIAALCAAVLVLHLLRPHQSAVPPWLVVVVVLLGAAGAVAGMLGGLADLVPRNSMLPRLGLPIAAGVLLAGVALCEIVGIVAARAQLQLPWLDPMPAETVTAGFDADPDQLLRQVDLELQRQWAEGVPNRCYAWLPPQLAPGADAGDFSITVLEESQPLVPPSGQERVPAAEHVADRRSSLLWLDGLGLAGSLCGGLLWLGLAFMQLRNPGASWIPGAAGLACLLVGTYAVRAGHLLWSRVEVRSTLTWLDVKGHCLRLPELPVDAASGSPGEPTLRVDTLRLQARVVQARSIFYAAAPHRPGSRTLLELATDRQGASRWVQLTQDFARQFALPDDVALAAVTSPPPVAPLSGARRQTPSRAQAGGRVRRVGTDETPPRRPARFCPHCGTPVLAGSRFCQQCGSVLSAD